jgi:hypothetical protein
MEPLIDPDATFRQASDTRAVLKELPDDLTACMASLHSLAYKIHDFESQAQQVKDFLCDKLYNQSSQLVEAHDHIRNLEEERHNLLGQFLQQKKRGNM